MGKPDEKGVGYANAARYVADPNNGDEVGKARAQAFMDAYDKKHKLAPVPTAMPDGAPIPNLGTAPHPDRIPQQPPAQEAPLLPPPVHDGTYSSPAPQPPPPAQMQSLPQPPVQTQASQVPQPGSPQMQATGADILNEQWKRSEDSHAASGYSPIPTAEQIANRKASREAEEAARGIDRSLPSASHERALYKSPHFKAMTPNFPTYIYISPPIADVEDLYTSMLDGPKGGAAKAALADIEKLGKDSKYYTRFDDMKYRVAVQAAEASGEQSVVRPEMIEDETLWSAVNREGVIGGLGEWLTQSGGGDEGFAKLISEYGPAAMSGMNVATFQQASNMLAAVGDSDSPVDVALQQAGFGGGPLKGYHDLEQSGGLVENILGGVAGLASGGAGALYKAVGKKWGTGTARDRMARMAAQGASDMAIDSTASAMRQIGEALVTGADIEVAPIMKQAANEGIVGGLMGAGMHRVGELGSSGMRASHVRNPDLKTLTEGTGDIVSGPGWKGERGLARRAFQGLLDPHSPFPARASVDDDIIMRARETSEVARPKGDPRMSGSITEEASRIAAPKVARGLRDKAKKTLRAVEGNRARYFNSADGTRTGNVRKTHDALWEYVDRHRRAATPVSRGAGETLANLSDFRVMTQEAARAARFEAERTRENVIIIPFKSEDLRKLRFDKGAAEAMRAYRKQQKAALEAGKKASKGPKVSSNDWSDPVSLEPVPAAAQVAPYNDGAVVVDDMLGAPGMQPGFGGSPMRGGRQLHDPKTGGVGKRGKDNVAKRGDANDPELMTTARKGDAMRGYGVPHGPHQMGEGVNRAEAPHVPSQRELDEGLDSANAAGSRIDPAGLGRDPIQYDIDRTGLGDAPTYVKHGDEAAKPAERGIGDMIASEVDRPAAAPAVDDMLGAPGMQPGFGGGRFAPRQPLRDPNSPGKKFAAQKMDDEAAEKGLVVVVTPREMSAADVDQSIKHYEDKINYGSGSEDAAEWVKIADQNLRADRAQWPGFQEMMDQNYKLTSRLQSVGDKMQNRSNRALSGAATHRSWQDTVADGNLEQVGNLLEGGNKKAIENLAAFIDNKAVTGLIKGFRAAQAHDNISQSSPFGAHMAQSAGSDTPHGVVNYSSRMFDYFYGPFGVLNRLQESGQMPKAARLLMRPESRAFVAEHWDMLGEVQNAMFNKEAEESLGEAGSN